jgi:chromosome segregation ATPase
LSNAKVLELQQKIGRLERQLKERSPENGHGVTVDGQLVKEEDVLDKQLRVNDSLRVQIADLHQEIQRLQQQSTKPSGTTGKATNSSLDEEEVDSLRLELVNSQNELIACKLKLSQCTEKMESLEKEVIRSRQATVAIELDSSANNGHGVSASQRNGLFVDNHANLSQVEGDSTFSSQIQSEIEHLQELLMEARTAKANSDERVHTLQCELEATNKQLDKTQFEFEESQKTSCSVSQQLNSMKEELELVCYQNKMATTCAIVPLLALALAILMAFYPAVSSMTGTSES